jgi:transcriptional regulator with XRE-family HTH domain
MTFGQFIVEARKKAGLSQKDLAAYIKKEDGEAISPQYLNDIEHDRRNPPSKFILEQIAKRLEFPLEYLLFLAGEYPQDIRGTESTLPDPKQVEAAFKAFRRALKGKN